MSQTNNSSVDTDWYKANYRYLMAEVTRIRRFLETFLPADALIQDIDTHLEYSLESLHSENLEN